MGYIKIKCAECNKEIFLLEQYVKGSMFCTIGCMEKNENKPQLTKRL